MRQLKQDSNGLIVNIGIAAILGVVLVLLAVLGYYLQTTILWEYSWALIGVGALLLSAKLVGMNLWAMLIVPVAAMALWVFGVMGGI
jgi:hypothetical protein